MIQVRFTSKRGPLPEPVMLAMPLSWRRRMWFWGAYHRSLPLRDPVTFAEKMNWRIVNDRRDVLAVTCDKQASKDFARERCADLPLRVPATYWKGTDVGELASADLPAYWVLKPNHRSGQVMFGAGAPDVEALREETKGWTDEWPWWLNGEWAYKFAEPAILVEEQIGAHGEVAPDYKIYVYDGVPRYVQVIEGRQTGTTQRFYTPDWQPLEWQSNSPLGPVRERPAELDSLVQIAGRLGEPFDFMRVDLYISGGEIWFGEFTTYSHGGYRVSPTPGVDEILGKLWRLPALSS